TDSEPFFGLVAGAFRDQARFRMCQSNIALGSREALALAVDQLIRRQQGILELKARLILRRRQSRRGREGKEADADEPRGPELSEKHGKRVTVSRERSQAISSFTC